MKKTLLISRQKKDRNDIGKQKNPYDEIFIERWNVPVARRKSISRISTKELCEVDDINRSTFFLHYGQPEDVLHEAEKDAIEELMHDFGQLFPRWVPNSVSETFFRKIFQKKEIYRFLFNQPDENVFVEGLKKGFLKATTICIL